MQIQIIKYDTRVMLDIEDNEDVSFYFFEIDFGRKEIEKYYICKYPNMYNFKPKK